VIRLKYGTRRVVRVADPKGRQRQYFCLLISVRGDRMITRLGRQESTCVPHYPNGSKLIGRCSRTQRVLFEA
jgi:hypothetical protein